MVITGFTSFINSQCNLRKPYELHDTKLLIEGHALQSLLYRQSSAHQKDNIYAVDYTTYAEAIRKFLRRLKICNIEPIIVYDGSINPSKYKKCFDKRIVEINKIKRENYRCDNESPTLANYVFTSVMREFGVKIIQTHSNTFIETVKLVNKLKCPIVSNKSEYFVFNIEYGVIQFDKFCCMKLQLHYDNLDNYWFIRCKRFHINHLLNKYIDLRSEVIPLFATIMENNLITTSKCFQLCNKFEASKRLVHDYERHENIDVLLNWLREKSAEKAIELLKPYLNEEVLKNGKYQTESNIRFSMKKYELDGNDAILGNFLFDSNTECESSLRDAKLFAEGDYELRTLPNWFLNDYQKGIIRPAIMNVVKMKTHVLYPQIEDFSLPSSFECTISLRKFLYGILRTDIDNMTPIKVLDRNGLSKSEEKVEPLLYLANNTQELPFLSTIRNLDIERRKILLMNVLDINQSFINRSKVSLMLFDWCEKTDMIDSWTFLIIVIRYWIKNNKQFDWKPFVGALILSIIFYSRQDLRTDEWIDLCKAPKLDDTFEPLIVHFFSQFQACLHVIHFINSILGNPLREGTPYYCLNGVFLYNATFNLSKSEDHEQYIGTLFGKWSVARLYYKILHLVLYGIDFDRLTSS